MQVAVMQFATALAGCMITISGITNQLGALAHIQTEGPLP